MKIHFYGRLADALGTKIELDVRDPCSVADLRERLTADFPQAADTFATRVRACVGDTIVTDSHVVAPDGSVDFFPPVSGG